MSPESPVRRPFGQVPAAPEEPPRDELRLSADAPVVLHLDPPSFAAEQYRTLAVQIEERVGPASGGQGYALAVTSAEEKAGKTLTALNIALALARGGERRVLLVEADLWRPGLRGYFEGEWPAERGLLQVLSGTLTVPQATVRIPSAGLDLLASGSTGRVGDVLSSRRLVELFADLRRRYELIVIDTPPLPLLAGARAIAGRADGVVFIVRADQSRRSGIEHALAALGRQKLIGIVFNAMRVHRRGYY